MKKSRQELFELVWSMPMTKLSNQFELSDVGLRKICVKHQIPLPLQGHWTRKQFGKEAPRPELPDKDFNPTIEINDDYKIKLNKERSELKKVAIKIALNPPTSQLRSPEQLKHERCITAFNEIKEFIVEMEKKQNVVKFETIKDKPPSFPPTHIFSFSYFRSSRNGFPLYATARNAIRPTDIRNMQHKHVEVIKREWTYLRLTLPPSKGHSFPITTMPWAVKVYERICRRQEIELGRPVEPTDYVFMTQAKSRDNALKSLAKQFDIVLDATGLKVSNLGEPRSLYSLRHSSIMFRLMFGRTVDTLTIARNARTSPEMIDRFYAAPLQGEMNIGELQSKRRPRPWE